MNINTAKHQLQLSHMLDLLQAQGIAANYFEAVEETGVDMVVVNGPETEEQQILLAFIDLPEDEYTAIDLMQFHATIAEELALAQLSEIYLFVAQVNNYLPFGNMCVVDNTVCLRHIVPHARFDNIDEAMLLDLLNLFTHVLGIATDTIHQLNTGQIDHEQALAQFG